MSADPFKMTEEADQPQFQLISKKDWSLMNTFMARTDLWAPITRVLFLYGTQTEECYSKQECIPLLQRLQRDDIIFKKYPDINHNFLIGGDGNIYEGRGWSQKCSPRTDFPIGCLILTYIGDFAVDDPPESMFITANQFIQHYVGEKKIIPTWQKYYVRGY